MYKKISDEFIFGHWWEISYQDYANMKLTMSEYNYVVRCLKLYEGLNVPFIKSRVKILRDIFDDIQKENIIPDFKKQNLYLMNSCKITMTEEEISDIINNFYIAADISKCSLKNLGNKIVDRWGLNEELTDTKIYSICESMGFCIPEIFVASVPPSLFESVDQAMFLPMPKDFPITILFNPNYLKLGDIDASTRARILLAIAHEICGHAMDHSALERSSQMMKNQKLDKESCEGWGIFAEKFLTKLGVEETSLYHLYRIKRLLPLAYNSLSANQWAKLRSDIELAWPNYFTSPDTGVLRRTTGTHARGLIRVERSIKEFGIPSARKEMPIWVPIVD